MKTTEPAPFKFKFESKAVLNRVKELREGLGMTQRQLAEISGHSVSTIETGRRINPRRKTAEAIAIALRQPMTTVFPGWKEPTRKGLTLTAAQREKIKSKAPGKLGYKPGRVKCRWCGGYYKPEDAAALVVGGKIIKEYGHENCLKESIRTEKFA